MSRAAWPQQAKQYDLVRVIRRVGTSVVYEARELSQLRPCAVKVVPKTATNAKAVLREAELHFWASRRSEGVLPLFAFFEDSAVEPGAGSTVTPLQEDRAFFLVSELCEGGDLSSCAALRDLPRIVRLVRSVVDTVRALHRDDPECLVHCDLKPHNFVFADRSQTRLLLGDFGVSLLYRPGDEPPKYSSMRLDDLKSRMEYCNGTPGYCAPEQVSKHKIVGRPADVFGIGCLTHFLLCGHCPFDDPVTDASNGSEAARRLMRLQDSRFRPVKRFRERVQSDRVPALRNHRSSLDTQKECHDVIDFLRASLCVDARLRNSAQQLFHHAFLTSTVRRRQRVRFFDETGERNFILPDPRESISAGRWRLTPSRTTRLTGTAPAVSMTDEFIGHVQGCTRAGRVISDDHSTSNTNTNTETNTDSNEGGTVTMAGNTVRIPAVGTARRNSDGSVYVRFEGGDTASISPSFPPRVLLLCLSSGAVVRVLSDYSLTCMGEVDTSHLRLRLRQLDVFLGELLRLHVRERIR
ncbi:MAG: hypothetical protein MHM6MM_004197 [Cercozoa sp. M6MM]